MDRRKKLLVNQYEHATDVELRAAAVRLNARVCPKVRIADALDINNSGINNQEYSYALKAHFDFVIVDGESKPVFSVEFDEPYHDYDIDAVRRDALKNSICEKLEMPLLRVDATFLLQIGKSRFSVLSWMAEVCFLFQGFCIAQSGGQIPYDEPFDYSAFLGWGYEDGGRVVDVDQNDVLARITQLFEGKSHAEKNRQLSPSENLGTILGYGRKLFTTRPYDPFLPYRAQLQKWREKNILIAQPEFLRARDPNGYQTSVVILRLSQEKSILGIARCRIFQFPPISPLELSEELSIVDGGEKILRYRRGECGTSTAEEVEAWQKRINSWNTLASRV